MKQVVCKSCFKAPLEKNEIGACKKLLGDDGDGFLCLECLASYLECSVDDLLDKIEEFKDEGCELFQ